MIDKIARLINTNNSNGFNHLIASIVNLDFETFNNKAIPYATVDQYFIANINNEEFGLVFNNDVFLLKDNQIKKDDVSNYNIVSFYKPTDCDIIPTEMELALNKTPMGLKAKEYLLNACDEKYLQNGKKSRLEVQIQNDLLLDEEGYEHNANAQTIALNKKKWLIEVTLADTIPEKHHRTKNWSKEEKLSIITIHEKVHLLFNTDGTLSGDNVKGNWTLGHSYHMSEEFKARLEYSLLYPNKSNTKSEWINAYFWWFSVYDIVFNENNIPNSLKIAKNTFQSSWDSEDALCLDGLSELGIFINEEMPLDFSDSTKYDFGKTICFNLYNELILSWNEIERKLHSKIDEILKNKYEYFNDVAFDKIV